MKWRAVLAFLSGLGTRHPLEVRHELMARLDASTKARSREVMGVEASALSRAIQAESDPNRREMRRLNIERSGVISAAFDGLEERRSPGLDDMRDLMGGVLDRRSGK